MAVVEGLARTCDRDDRLAVTRMRFSFDGRFYIVDLCATHLEMFHRDMMAWARYGDELTLEPAESPEPLPATRMIVPEGSSQDRDVVRGATVKPIVPQVRRVLEDDVTVIPEAVPDLTGIRPTTMRDWTFTKSARTQMDLKDVAIPDVWRVLDANGKTKRPGRDGLTEVWEWQGLGVVVNPRDQIVITIMKFGQPGSRRLAMTPGGN